MKRILFIASFLVAGSMTTTLYAQKKSKKAKKQAPVQLITRSDSISYSSAKMFNRGFDEYIKQNFDLDSTTVTDFLKGFDDYMANKDSNQQRAYMAGQSVADMVLRRFMVNVQNDFKDREVQIDEGLFVRGFRDAVEKQDGAMTTAEAEQYFRSIAQQAEVLQKQKVQEDGKRFLEENAKLEGVITTPSGLQYRVLREGTGAIPAIDDDVTVKYEGKLIDGTVFDSSYNRKPETAVFKPSSLIKGWTEALCMMPVGSKWELFVPYELGYGDRRVGKIPAYSTLIFTLELEDTKPARTAYTEELSPAKAVIPKKDPNKKGLIPPSSRADNKATTGAPEPGPAIHPKPMQ